MNFQVTPFITTNPINVSIRVLSKKSYDTKNIVS